MGQRQTYAEYLRVHELLALQDGGPHNERVLSSDEHHFVVVHQAFELWFSRVLFELRSARDLLATPPVPESAIPGVVHQLERVAEIFRLLTSQWKVMETLAPQEFLAFRDELGTASGFESFQMRELELLLGLGVGDRVGGMDPVAHFRRLAGDSEAAAAAWARIERTIAEPDINEVLTAWLARTPIHGSGPEDEGDAEVVRDFVTGHLARMEELNAAHLERFAAVGQTDLDAVRGRFAASEAAARDFLLPDGEPNRARAGLLFIETYRDLPLLAWPRRLIDMVVELEEGILLFRAHHARMVERIIGRRVGTGGSSGVDYLDATLRYRIFTDLWQVRTLLLKRAAVPDVPEPGFYDFTQPST